MTHVSTRAPQTHPVRPSPVRPLADHRRSHPLLHQLTGMIQGRKTFTLRHQVDTLNLLGPVADRAFHAARALSGPERDLAGAAYLDRARLEESFNAMYVAESILDDHTRAQQKEPDLEGTGPVLYLTRDRGPAYGPYRVCSVSGMYVMVTARADGYRAEADRHAACWGLSRGVAWPTLDQAVADLQHRLILAGFLPPQPRRKMSSHFRTQTCQHALFGNVPGVFFRRGNDEGWPALLVEAARLGLDTDEAQQAATTDLEAEESFPLQRASGLLMTAVFQGWASAWEQEHGTLGNYR